MKYLVSFTFIAFILICSTGYAGIDAINYPAVYNKHILSSIELPSVEQENIFPLNLQSDHSDQFHLADHRDYQLLYGKKHGKKYELDRIMLSYQNPTSQEIKTVEIPVKTCGEKQSTGHGSGSQQQGGSTSTSSPASSSPASSGAGGGTGGGAGAGGDAPPPPDPNKRASTSFEYIADSNVGLFGWIIAWFNYWWISESANYAASWLAQQVPDNQLTHWISEHEVLTGAGFMVVGITTCYIADQTVGHWSLSPTVHRALMVGSGIHVLNWFSPQIYARLSQQSHYTFLSFFGYRFGTFFASHLRKRFAPPPYNSSWGRH